MEISEITEEEPEYDELFINKEAQREKIRRMLHHQKSLFLSSSTTSSSSSSHLSCSNPTEASRSSWSSWSSEESRSSNLLGLMKTGSTSLGRLFGMEHTTLAAHFHDYSCSFTTKTIPLWGSDAEDDQVPEGDPWESFRGFAMKGLPGKLGSDSSSYRDEKLGVRAATVITTRRRSRRGKLSRKQSFKKLPRFRFWRWRLRLRRFRIMICGKIF